MKKSEEMERLKDLKKAIDNLEGVPIPFDLIVGCINPLSEWLDTVVIEDEKEEAKKEKGMVVPKAMPPTARREAKSREE